MAAVQNFQDEHTAVIAIRSEVFSHRDKNYSSKKLASIAKRAYNSRQSEEIQLMGCGFSEAMYAIVTQLMQQCDTVRNSVNIEALDWGDEGYHVLREIENFLGKAGISVNAWLPCSNIATLKNAPRAELNIVKRVRWAQCMKEKFGTDYLIADPSDRHAGLDGIGMFYREIAEKLGLSDVMDELIDEKLRAIDAETGRMTHEISQYRCLLVCNSISSAPGSIKRYVREFGLNIAAICIERGDADRAEVIPSEVNEGLLTRISDAAAVYAPDIRIVIDPDDSEVESLVKGIDVIVGSDKPIYEKYGTAVIPSSVLNFSLSYESYLRSYRRLLNCLIKASSHKDLILNRMPFTLSSYPRLETRSSHAARVMREEMWLKRGRDQ